MSYSAENRAYPGSTGTLSPLQQTCEIVTADLQELLRDLQDMKKAMLLLESHLL